MHGVPLFYGRLALVLVHGLVAPLHRYDLRQLRFLLARKLPEHILILFITLISLERNDLGADLAAVVLVSIMLISVLQPDRLLFVRALPTSINLLTANIVLT